MCGIFGYVKQEVQKKDLQMLRECTNILEHRGPDDSAYYTDKTCGLGMRRLAILDLSSNLYPFYSKDKQKVLIFNGEIYNFRDLKNELESLGHEFETHCDGEVIIHGFDRWGTKVFSKLRGMFAIAVWDIKNQRLVLARDRIGIKPLYYFKNKDDLYFSSEVKALLNLRKHEVQFSLDLEKVKTLLGFMFLPNSKSTIIQGISKVQPGTYLEITKKSVTEHAYWNLSEVPENSNISFDEAGHELEALLVKTIKQHLISDVPIGVMLSGGIDSSLLTAIITQNKMLETVNTYTAKFDHPSNESDSAKKVAYKLGTKHHEIFIDVSDVNKNMEKLISHFDDLSTLDGGLITTELLCNKIRKDGIKVLLLGEGADEVLGGYSWFGISQLPFKIMPASFRNAIYYYAISRNLTRDTAYYYPFWNKCVPKNSDVFREICLAELEKQLPNHLLMKVDKASMANSIEARVPYLDHKFIEFVFSLPSTYKLAGSFYNPARSNEKYILRHVAQKYLPEHISTKKKRGFLLPMKEVLESDLDKVKDYILRENSVSSNILSIKFKQNLFDQVNNKLRTMQKEYFIWRLFLLEIWVDQNQII
jgi:asparagine synthase (glutamine-hydrolysing)